MKKYQLTRSKILDDRTVDCALFDKSMTFSAWLVDTILVNFRCGGKSELTSEGRERSNSI